MAWIGRGLLRLAGWRVLGAAPQAPKYILLCAPHTSNWDLPLMLAAGMALGIWPHWVGKHSLFKPPFGPLARALRGIAVDRRAASHMVAQLSEAFAQRERMVLAVSPEGTRGKAPHWKSGFYRLSLAAGVPIALAYLDYSRKTAAIGPLLLPTGDVRADMDVVRAFYQGREGRHPERQGPVRLAAEDAPAETPKPPRP